MLLLVSSILVLAISSVCITVVDVLVLHTMVAMRMGSKELFPVCCIAVFRSASSSSRYNRGGLPVAFVPILPCARI